MKSPPVVVITGGSRGIGAALALRCGSAGCRIAVNYLTRENEAEEIVSRIKKCGGEAIAVRADVRNRDRVHELFDRVEEEFGGCDWLVNNAHTRVDARPFHQLRWTDFQEQIDGCLKSVFLCCQAVLPLLREGGAILNMSSVTVRVPSVGLAHRSAAKGAVEALTKHLAVALAERRIRVNALSIGWTDTDQIWTLGEATVERQVRAIPLQRLASPDEIAEAALFLLSDKASYMTGVVFPIDGGLDSTFR